MTDIPVMVWQMTMVGYFGTEAKVAISILCNPGLLPFCDWVCITFTTWLAVLLSVESIISLARCVGFSLVNFGTMRVTIALSVLNEVWTQLSSVPNHLTVWLCAFSRLEIINPNNVLRHSYSVYAQSKQLGSSPVTATLCP